MKPFFKLNYPHVHQKQNLVYFTSQNMPLHSYNKLFLLGEDLRKDKVVDFFNYTHIETTIMLYNIHTTANKKTI